MRCSCVHEIVLALGFTINSMEFSDWRFIVPGAFCHMHTCWTTDREKMGRCELVNSTCSLASIILIVVSNILGVEVEIEFHVYFTWWKFFFPMCRYIFGIPGEENLDFLDSLRTSKMKLVVTRHEQAAGFMAATVGRLTGKVGCCLSTLGPGATNFATAAAYAQLAGFPMVTTKS